jgi:hypothetical protein
MLAQGQLHAPKTVVSTGHQLNCHLTVMAVSPIVARRLKDTTLTYDAFLCLETIFAQWSKNMPTRQLRGIMIVCVHEFSRYRTDHI